MIRLNDTQPVSAGQIDSRTLFAKCPPLGSVSVGEIAGGSGATESRPKGVSGQRANNNIECISYQVGENAEQPQEFGNEKNFGVVPVFLGLYQPRNPDIVVVSSLKGPASETLLIRQLKMLILFNDKHTRPVFSMWFLLPDGYK